MTPVIFHTLTDFGAIGDGKTLNTQAFSQACAAIEHAGGGTILVPPGRFVTGSIRLPSHTNLHLMAGAVILGSQNAADYPLRDQPWEGSIQKGHDPLIGARDAKQVSITGQGSIDGQGEPWWQAQRNQTLQFNRPRLMSFETCERVVIQDVTLRNSPAWTIHPWRCSDVQIQGVSIHNPPNAPNTDGIDPESCTDVRIEGCLIDVGDDCIVIKSGTVDGGRDHPPCERISISNCHLVRGHGGVVIGSEMSGGVRDVVIANCFFQGTDRGIRIKTRRGRGGIVENLSVMNVLMRQVGCPLVIHAYYRYTRLRPEEREWAGSLDAQAVSDLTPIIRRIRLSGVSATDVGGPALVYLHGIPEAPIEDVVISDCDFSHHPDADPAQIEPAMMIQKAKTEYQTGGVFATHVAGLRLQGTRLKPRSGRLVTLESVRDYEGPSNNA